MTQSRESEKKQWKILTQLVYITKIIYCWTIHRGLENGNIEIWENKHKRFVTRTYWYYQHVPTSMYILIIQEM